MASREHRLRLPARLRWTTRLRQKIELAETSDVSRRGLLVSSREPHAAGVEFWVTFPYDPALPGGQPELLAPVVPWVTSPGHGHHTPVAGGKTSWRAPFALAIHFLGPGHPRTNGNRARPDRERRGSPRRLLAVPLRVRPEQTPWFEETMSLDLSERGMRFRSHPNIPRVRS